MDEVFKPVSGYGGAYEISNLGNVRSVTRKVIRRNGRVISIKGKDMAMRTDEKGYMRVCLNNNGKTKRVAVHRLVAMAYLPNPDNKPQINHIDGNKGNNCVWNLEWCTNGENQKHAYRTGLKHSVDSSGRPKVRVAMIDPVSGEQVATFESFNEAARKMKIFAPNIRKVVLGERNTTGGWKWKAVM